MAELISNNTQSKKIINYFKQNIAPYNVRGYVFYITFTVDNCLIYLLIVCTTIIYEAYSVLKIPMLQEVLLQLFQEL
jgi:hypothetical protein